MKLIHVQQKIVDDLVNQIKDNMYHGTHRITMFMPRHAGKETIKKAVQKYFAEEKR